MKYSFYIGIDMSKPSFDYCLIDAPGTILKQGGLLNQKPSIAGRIAELGREFGGPEFWTSCLLCSEHSGYCGTPLLTGPGSKVKTDIWLENELQTKRSMGMQRGKNDKVDAGRIASYCLDFQRKAQLWRPTKANIERWACCCLIGTAWSKT